MGHGGSMLSCVFETNTWKGSLKILFSILFSLSQSDCQLKEQGQGNVRYTFSRITLKLSLLICQSRLATNHSKNYLISSKKIFRWSTWSFLKIIPFHLYYYYSNINRGNTNFVYQRSCFLSVHNIFQHSLP